MKVERYVFIILYSKIFVFSKFRFKIYSYQNLGVYDYTQELKVVIIVPASQ